MANSDNANKILPKHDINEIGYIVGTREHALAICDQSLAKAGYKILDGDGEVFYIQHGSNDFMVSVTEITSSPIIISSFEDFLSKFNQFYFAMDSIQPAFCLEYAHDSFWTFECAYSKQQLNTDIAANKHLFNWQETKAFYYPNTNMFSGNNAESNIKGYIVTKKTTKG